MGHPWPLLCRRSNEVWGWPRTGSFTVRDVKADFQLDAQPPSRLRILYERDAAIQGNGAKRGISCLDVRRQNLFDLEFRERLNEGSFVAGSLRMNVTIRVVSENAGQSLCPLTRGE